MSAVRYNVRVKIGEELADRFAGYMRSKHIPDVLATGKFEAAEISRSEDGSFLVSYLALSGQDLNDYLARHTETMREAFRREFPFEAKVEREVLEIIDVIEAG